MMLSCKKEVGLAVSILNVTLFSFCFGYKLPLISNQNFLLLIIFIFSIPDPTPSQTEKNASFPMILCFPQIAT